MICFVRVGTRERHRAQHRRRFRVTAAGFSSGNVFIFHLAIAAIGVWGRDGLPVSCSRRPGRGETTVCQDPGRGVAADGGGGGGSRRRGSAAPPRRRWCDSSIAPRHRLTT